MHWEPSVLHREVDASLVPKATFDHEIATANVFDELSKRTSELEEEIVQALKDDNDRLRKENEQLREMLASSQKHNHELASRVASLAERLLDEHVGRAGGCDPP